MTQGTAGESTSNRVSADVGIEFVPSLPGGRAALAAEKEGRFVWLIAEGAMTDQCRREMRDYLSHIVRTGMWTQNWPRPQRPQYC